MISIHPEDITIFINDIEIPQINYFNTVEEIKSSPVAYMSIFRCKFLEIEKELKKHFSVKLVYTNKDFEDNKNVLTKKTIEYTHCFLTKTVEENNFNSSDLLSTKITFEYSDKNVTTEKTILPQILKCELEIIDENFLLDMDDLKAIVSKAIEKEVQGARVKVKGPYRGFQK